MFNKNNYNNEKITVAVIFSGIAAVFSMAGLFFNGSGSVSEQTVINALTKMEAMKVGGMDNRNKLVKVYTDPQFTLTQSNNIDDALSSFGAGSDNSNNTNPNTQTPTSANLSEEQIASLLGNNPIKGNKDSDIIIVEYTDLECPFCQMHNANGTVNNLIASDNIGYIIKAFPLSSIHPQAQKAAEGNLCVLELAGEDAYFNYTDKVFSSKNPSLSNITTIAVELGIKEADFTSCLNSGKYIGTITEDMNEGQSLFSINGTPGNVIINKNTGKYIVISGAQGAGAFQNAINQLKN